MKRALLLSGGMDSVSIAWWKRPEVAFTVDYGQRAAIAEQKAASTVAKQLGIEWHPIVFHCQELGSGDMAGTAPDPLAPASDWWPYRNQLLVTLVAMRAVGLGIEELMLGTVATDNQHADGSTAFVAAIDSLLSLQEGGLRVTAPAIGLDAEALVRISGVPRDLLSWAHSCHKADVACGQCRGCNKYFETWVALHDYQAS